LQDSLGFSVTADNIIITNEFVANTINISKLNNLLSGDIVQFNLSDILTEHGRNKLGKNFKEVEIFYLADNDRLIKKYIGDRANGGFLPYFTTSGSPAAGKIVLANVVKNSIFNT